jgi:TonB family protein
MNTPVFACGMEENMGYRVRRAIQLLAVAASLAFPMEAFPAMPGGELGTWWRDSDVVRDLRLSDDQIRQIDQSFRSHRPELSSLASELQRQESILQSIIESPRFDEKKAAAQIDQVVNARAWLEKEKTMLALDIRRTVDLDQWKRLQEIQRAQGSAAPSVEEPVYQVGGPVTEPVPIQKPTPPFTAEANRRKVQGSVLLDVLIGKDGIVRSVRVLRGIGFGLDESAVDTVTKRWFFKPATLNGQPVTVQAKIEIMFRMY